MTGDDYAGPKGPRRVVIRGGNLPNQSRSDEIVPGVPSEETQQDPPETSGTPLAPYDYLHQLPPEAPMKQRKIITSTTFPLVYVEGENTYGIFISDDLTPEQVINRVASRWDMTKRYPLPKFGLRCFCGSNEHLIRYYLFHQHSNAYPHRFRCRADVGMKCLYCGHIFVFGVPLTEQYWNQWGHKPGRVVWQEARDKLAADEAR